MAISSPTRDISGFSYLLYFYLFPLSPSNLLYNLLIYDVYHFFVCLPMQAFPGGGDFFLTDVFQPPRTFSGTRVEAQLTFVARMGKKECLNLSQDVTICYLGTEATLLVLP